jgi:hypothetical protein
MYTRHMSRADGRTEWFAPDLKIKSEPLLVSLVKYNRKKDRVWRLSGETNLVSSKTAHGTHKPILDLDIPILLEPSTAPGHHHLYIDIEMPWWRYAAMLTGLYAAGVIEMGFYVWSLRRGGTWVRKPGVVKTEAESTKSEYGWLFRTQ